MTDNLVEEIGSQLDRNRPPAAKKPKLTGPTISFSSTYAPEPAERAPEPAARAPAAVTQRNPRGHQRGSPRLVVNAADPNDVLLKVHYFAFGIPLWKADHST
jgi:hypothetical protein